MAHTASDTNRSFLFLQGPHGPFFHQLAKALAAAGAKTWRVGFNAGDRAFWPTRSSYLRFDQPIDEWPEYFEQIAVRHEITDIVLYGDTRPIHAEAVTVAKGLGLQVHVFEEGYLRPYWVTYERDGSNGNSPLIGISLSQMQRAQDDHLLDKPIPPGHWGDMRQHIFYGAVYHWFVMFANKQYRHFKPHRALPVNKEFLLYFKRLILMPLHAAARAIATRRIRSGHFPYHLVLLQFEHDSSFQMHGQFETQSDFLHHVIKGFARGAPNHHHLVFKAHPLENGRAPLNADIRRFATNFKVTDRIHYVRGGKLAPLLDDARSAVTVNSTAGQQALWRGLPLRNFGACVYDKTSLVSRQPIAEFFAEPSCPDPKSYSAFRDFLLATSQLPGGFYSARGRQQLLRQVADLMLRADDPYALPAVQTEADKQQLRVVK